MDKRIEFYITSIDEYPKHLCKTSLENSIKFLNDESDKLYDYILYLSNNLGADFHHLELDLRSINQSIKIGEEYLLNLELLQKAKKDFPIGTLFYDVFGKKLLATHEPYFIHDGMIAVRKYDGTVYCKGRWAEVISYV